MKTQSSQEKKFTESRMLLGHANSLLKGIQPPQMPPEAPMEPEMTEDTPQEPISKPTDGASEEPQEESRLERMFTEFMDTMNKLFKREQEKEPETPVTEEK